MLEDTVFIAWETASEIDNAGFHLWRSAKKNGKYRRITDEIIPARGTGIMESAYSFEDTNIKPKKTYYYKLEDIDINGVSTLHGPIKAGARR